MPVWLPFRNYTEVHSMSSAFVTGKGKQSARCRSGASAFVRIGRLGLVWTNGVSSGRMGYLVFNFKISFKSKI
jgi:hypothetical protein